jgi:hypothetical protein
MTTYNKRKHRDPFNVEEWLANPISLLARCGSCIIKSEGSAVNIYVPKEAAKEVVDVLNNNGAQWENFITDKLRDLRTYRMAVIPYQIIREAGKIMKKHRCLADNELNHDELCEYLHTIYFPSVLEPTKVPHEDYIDLFFSKLCQMIKECSLRELEDDVNMVWIFRIIGNPTTTVGNTSGKDKRIRVGFTALPSEYDDLMSSIYQTLDQYKQGTAAHRSASQ